MTTIASVDLDQALLDPASVFSAPNDVLTAPITANARQAILQRWEEDAEALLRATEEGMSPEGNRGAAEILVAVHAALRALDETD